MTTFDVHSAKAIKDLSARLTAAQVELETLRRGAGGDDPALRLLSLLSAAQQAASEVLSLRGPDVSVPVASLLAALDDATLQGLEVLRLRGAPRR